MSATNKRALRILRMLMKAGLEPESHDLARQIEMRLKLPMTTVLDAVPGDSIAERSRQIGITRATYYSWHEGRSRPKLELAKRLEELTGISAEAIIAQPRSPQ